MAYQIKSVVSETHGYIYSVGMYPSTEFIAMDVHKDNMQDVVDLIEELARREMATVITERGNCTIQLRNKCDTVTTYGLIPLNESYLLKQSLFVGMHMEANVVEIKPVTRIVVAKFANVLYKQEINDLLPLNYPLLFHTDDVNNIYTIHNAMELDDFFDTLMQIYKEENNVDLS